MRRGSPARELNRRGRPCYHLDALLPPWGNPKPKPVPKSVPAPGGGTKGGAATGAAASKPAARTPEDILAEYRSLYPAYVQRQYPGMSIEMKANASASGNQYLCSYIAWDTIKDGPRKGERYKAVDFSRLFTLDQLAGQIVGMKKALGR